MKRDLSVFLALMLLVSILSGCVFKEKPSEIKVTADGLLTYHMDQSMVDRFQELLSQTQTLAIAGEDLEKTQEVSEKLEEAYMDLFDQYQTAYVMYCLDQSDKTAQERYLHCVEVVADAEAAYNASCKQIWLSETPLRDELFAEWSQEEINRMLSYNDEIAQLEKRNEEITVEYRGLTVKGDEWKQAMIGLYNEMVSNNNRIAELYGYANYYEYAYDVVYQRDYEPEQIQMLRQYAAAYLPEIYGEASAQYGKLYERLGKQDQNLISELQNQNYDSIRKNYVDLYIADMPESSKEIMRSMFTENRAVFTSYKNAYKGAFTTFIDDQPFCYFGPGYCDSETVIHEMGHYYGSDFAESWSQPVDLAETQSQGNEWLFLQFMKSQLPIEVYECMVEEKLSSDIAYILCFVMVDQFEEMVYTHEKAGNLTLEEYDGLMEQVAEDFGGIEYISDILNVQNYWKRVVLETPVYYISYAVSGLAAMNLFTVAQTDEAAARQMYLTLVEDPVEDGGFLANIQNAQIAGPFEETVYEQLAERYGK